MSFYKDIFEKARKRLNHYFPKLGKWWDYVLYIFAVLAIIATYDALNNWLRKVIGQPIGNISMFIGNNRILLWLTVAATITLAAYLVVKRCKDNYRSISLFLLCVFGLILLAVSKEYWDYVEISHGVTFFHLFLIVLSSIGFSVLATPRTKSNHTNNESVSKRFTVDNVKATTDKADKNRAAYANDLVQRILNTDINTEALSVGISGEWGSGKSTFIELLRKAFENDKSGRVSTVVDFHPWDGASSGQIVSDFFHVLVNKLSDNYSVIKQPLLKYSDLLTAIDAKKTVVYLAGLLDKRQKRSLSETKNLISGYLKEYNKIIPVLIDDLDRLTADEISDVLMLIRNTADFPNIVYLAAYDKNYVCKQLKERRKIDNPSAYLEKFFSVELVLPKLDDQYQYDVLAEEIKSMNPNKELERFVENLPRDIKMLLCTNFQNFRQVKRFARIFVQDCDYFLQRPNASSMIELSDLFVLKMLLFFDEDTYLKLERNSSELVLQSQVLNNGFKPLQLKAGVLGEKLENKDIKETYLGKPLSETTKQILQRLFYMPQNGRKKTSFVNPECAPIYFMLNIPSHTIPLLEVKRAIAGDDDISKLFEEWKSGKKLLSLYNNLIGLEPKKMSENQAKRYLFLCLNLFPYLLRYRELSDHVLRSYHYDSGLYDSLKEYVQKQFVSVIDKASENFFEGYNRLMKSLAYIYSGQLEWESKNEELPMTLMGDSTEIKHQAEAIFSHYTMRFSPNTDELFRDNSLLRSIVEDAVVSLADEDGEWHIVDNMLSDVMVAYFKQHKGKDKELAAHYYDINADTPPQYEDDAIESKYSDMQRVFGREETYKAIIAEGFEESQVFPS